MNKRFFGYTISLLISIALLFSTSCSKDKNNKVEYSLKIGAMSSLDYIPYVVAQKAGIYDSLGLNIEIVKFFSANERDAAFRGGQVDGTVIDYTGAAIQHAGGMGLAIVMKHDGVFEMMAVPEIKSMEQLKGKKIGVSRNTVIEYTTDMMLQAYGMTENDIEKPEVNKIPLRMEMMLASELDASIFPDPFITISKAKGFNSLCSNKDLDISVTGTMLTQKVIEEKSDAIKLLIEGYNLGVQYMLDHPREEWSYILVEDAMIPENVANTVVLPEYTFAELPSKKDIDQTIKWLKDKELVPADYNGQGLVNPDFIPAK